MANETILVVDADTKSQKVLEVSFKKAGYRVTLTDSPVEARRLIAAEQPDLIISDTKFIDGNGFTFLAGLKESDSTRTIPFIFLTEERSLPQKMRGFELGADDYLTKPVYIKEVTTRVELLLQKRAKDLLSESAVEEMDGDLADITMIDLLQSIEDEMRSGTIRLTRSGREATVYFRQGNILDAICGKLQGEEAIYRLMLWPDGRFHLQYHEQVKRPDRVPKDSSELLMEGIRRLEIWNDIVDKLPAFTTVFEADYRKLPNLDLLPEPVARIARLFDGVRTLRDVLDDSPLDDVTTLQIAKKLFDDGALQGVVAAQTSTGPERTNLAAWLDGKHIRERENTAPKFGSMPRNERTTERLDLTDTAPLPRPEVESMAPQMVGHVEEGPLGADGKPAWKFHFDGEAKSNPNEAIRKIEEEERKRREAEAQVLTGQHRAITQHMIATVQRTPVTPAGSMSSFFDSVKAAEATFEEPVDPLKATDIGFGGVTDEGRSERVTERLIPTVSRDSRPKPEPVVEVSEVESQPLEIQPTEATPVEVKPVEVKPETRLEPRPTPESRQRMRQSTPISTPAQTTRLVDQRFEDDDDDEPEVQEASTKELPTAQQVSQAHDEFVAKRSVAEAEALMDQAVSLAGARPNPETATDDSWNRYGDELSEADAFADDEGEEKGPDTLDPLPSEIAESSADSGEAFEPGSDRQERVTRDLKPPATLFSTVEEDTSEPVVGPAGDITPFPGELPSEPQDEFELEEIPHVEVVPPLVERTARDGEMVLATFNLSRGRRPEVEVVPAEIVPPAVTPTSELETIELPAREQAGAQGDYAEPLVSVETPTEDLPRDDAGVAESPAAVEDPAPAAVQPVEAKPEPTPEPEAKSEPEPEAKPEPKSEPEAKSEPEPKSEPEAKSEPAAVEAVETPAAEPASHDDGHEQAFFQAADHSADDFHVADEAPNRTILYIGGAMVLAVLGLLFVIMKSGPTEDPFVEKPTEVAQVPAQVKPAEPAVTAVPQIPVGPAPDVAAAALGQDVQRTATDSAMVFAGVVVGFDAGQADGEVEVADAGQADAATTAVDSNAIAVKPEEPPVKVEPQPADVAKAVEPTTFEGRLASTEKLIKRESFGPALENLRTLGAEQPNNGKVAFLHGQAAFGALRNGEAIEQYLRAERLGFRPAGLYLDLGAAYQLEGNKDKARGAYEKFLELRPSGRDADEVRSILKNRF